MPTPEIQISKDGLKLSYQRYLADSAAGFLTILIVLLAVSNKVPLPFVGHSLEALAPLSSTSKIFICLLIFLLVTPVGLVINGLSWFSLGWIQFPLHKFWFNLPDKWHAPLFPTKIDFYFDRLEIFFQINSEKEIDGKHISHVYHIYEEYLQFFFAEKIRLEHVIGLSRFARNTAFLACISSLSSLHVILWNHSKMLHNAYPIIIFAFFVTVLAILLYSLVEGLRCLQVFSTVYFLCIARGITNDNPAAPEELIKKIHAAYFGDQSGMANSSNP